MPWKTWDVVSLFSRKQALGCKWVYIIKYKADGTIEWFKTHFIILGNSQHEGIDFTDPFFLVAKLVTVRALLSITSA